jgi:hypothetical protein
MIEVRDRYNGRITDGIVVPLTDTKNNPIMEPPVPALISEAIDGSAQLASSTRPMITVPSMDPYDDDAIKKAVIQRKAYYAIWHKNRLPMLIRRWYRHIAGYGMACLVVMPSQKRGRPVIQTRDPLTAYPDEMAPEEVRIPEDVGFVYGRSAAWITSVFPETLTYEYFPNIDDTGLWDLLEWVDGEDIFIGIMGPRSNQYSWRGDSRSTLQPLLLRHFPNKAGICTAVCPARLTLDRIASQVGKIVGITDLMARLMALEVIAAENFVFPTRYAIARPNMAPVITNGKWRDGRTGDINLLENVEKIGSMQDSPGPLTMPTIDRLERAGRMSGGTPGIFGGELTGAIRSGQTIMQAGSYSVDPKIQEMQEIMEYTLSSLNEALHHSFLGYYGNKKFTLFSGWSGEQGHAIFTPNEDFKTEENVVHYPFPGADANNVTVAAGQAKGAGGMSTRTFMEVHPMIDDPDEEIIQVMRERLDNAMLAATEQRSVSGELPEIDVAQIKKYLAKGESIEDAIIKAHKDAQKRQATEAPMPEAPLPGGEQMGMPPGAMPGLAAPGMGAEQMAPPEAIGPPPQSSQNFREVLNSLKGMGRA